MYKDVLYACFEEIVYCCTRKKKVYFASKINSFPVLHMILFYWGLKNEFISQVLEKIIVFLFQALLTPEIIYTIYDRNFAGSYTYATINVYIFFIQNWEKMKSLGHLVNCEGLLS